MVSTMAGTLLENLSISFFVFLRYSPEAIETCKFSSYSDVWSYGVTLFEMFSRGDVPNLVKGQELTQNDFLNRLRRGERYAKQEIPHLFLGLTFFF